MEHFFIVLEAHAITAFVLFAGLIVAIVAAKD